MPLSFLRVFFGVIAAAAASVFALAPVESGVVFRDYFGLTFKRPVVLAEIPGHPDHYLVAEQPGTIMLVQPAAADGNAPWEKIPFASLAVSGGRYFEDERGLLGLAFHPRFKDNGKYYVNYIAASTGATVIAERQADASRLKDGGKPERILLEIPQPYPNHNGGTIAFGPDGFLYIGTGDGGSGGDPENRAQNTRDLLGKILRIDVNRREGERAYAIPPENPFANRHKYRPEVWAIGLRNPWKWTFHPETGALWVADVGQGSREEISIVPRGGNMGWPIWEGDLCQEKDVCGAPGADGMTAPLVSLPRGEAVSITGGEFVTAATLAASVEPASGTTPSATPASSAGSSASFLGAYIFGDYGRGTVWALRKKPEGWERVRIGTVPTVSAFARDTKGRIFALGLKDGVIRVLDFPKAAAR